jgi:hypothetical protein
MSAKSGTRVKKDRALNSASTSERLLWTVVRSISSVRMTSTASAPPWTWFAFERDVAVDGYLGDIWAEQLRAGLQQEKEEGDGQKLPVGPQVAQYPGHQPGIVGLAEDLVFLLNFFVHSRFSTRPIESTCLSRLCRR